MSGDNSEIAGFDFNATFGQQHQGPPQDSQDEAHHAHTDRAHLTTEPTSATHQDFIELNIPERKVSAVEPTLPQAVNELPPIPHLCNDPAHQELLATPPQATTKTTAPTAFKTLTALAAVSSIKSKLQPAGDVHAKRRKTFKIVAILVVAVVGFNLLNNWAHSSTRLQATTAATGLNQSEQISNIEMVTADASLRREYSAVRLQLLRYGTLSNYQPTTGFAVITLQGRVAIVTSIGAHCWDLLADGNRTRLSHDSAACGPNATTLLQSELRAGI